MTSEGLEHELINEIETDTLPTSPTSTRYATLDKLSNRSLWESARDLIFDHIDSEYDNLTDDDKNKLAHVVGYFEDIVDINYRFVVKHVSVNDEKLILDLVDSRFKCEIWVNYETIHCMLLRFEDAGDFHCIINIGVDENA